ncbi:eggshell protein 1-like [Oppia nitens]|uniref:eggshell protein 1-like n=1 Tax=Oppia nitens TaxID=1686743 RepID=UPI0023DB5A0C|nr:eggshell protein 1-like [Oppia nitens]
MRLYIICLAVMLGVLLIGRSRAEFSDFGDFDNDDFGSEMTSGSDLSSGGDDGGGGGLYSRGGGGVDLYSSADMSHDLVFDETTFDSFGDDSDLLSGHKGWKKKGWKKHGHGKWKKKGHKGWKKHGGKKGWKKHGKGWKKHGGHKKGWKKHGGHKGWKKHGGHKKWKKW